MTSSNLRISERVALRYAAAIQERFEATQPVLQKLLQRKIKDGKVSIEKLKNYSTKDALTVMVKIKGDPEDVLNGLGIKTDPEKANLGGYHTDLLKGWMDQNLTTIRPVVSTWDIKVLRVDETSYSGWAFQPEKHDYFVYLNMTEKPKG